MNSILGIWGIFSEKGFSIQCKVENGVKHYRIIGENSGQKLTREFCTSLHSSCTTDGENIDFLLDTFTAEFYNRSGE